MPIFLDGVNVAPGSGGGGLGSGDFKESARLASTGNLSLSGLADIDGVTPVAGNRILAKDQTAGEDNGIYVAASGAWARASDFDEDAEVTSGASVFVSEGTANDGDVWALATADPIVVGTTVQVWIKIAGSSLVPHAATHVSTGSDPIDAATITVGGLMAAVDKVKLNGVETGATADQTGAEIKVAYEGEADTNAFTDAEKTKLGGVETGATADQTAGEIKTAYESNADTNEFSDAEQSKLAGIDAGATDDQSAAEVAYSNASSGLTATNVQDAIDEVEARVDTNDAKVSADGLVTTHSDVTSSGSGAIITVGERSNLPTTDQKAALVGTGTPAAGDPYVNDSDSRMTNARTPTAHAATHVTGGSDIIDGDILNITFVPTTYTRDITPAEVTLVTELTAHLKGIDLELATMGAGDVVGPGTATDSAIALYDGTTGKLIKNSVVTVDGSGNITTAGTVDGRDLSVDGGKLDGIESGATADQTDAEIKTAYENNADTNEFSDAEQSKLAGIETGATADQSAAEVAIADAGSRYTATDVEGALQEIAGAGRTTETVKANADNLTTHLNGGASKHDATEIDYERADGSKKNIQASSDDVENALTDLDDAIGTLVASPTNYTPSTATVTGHQAGIDTALGLRALDADVIKKDGSVAFTADQSMGTNKLTSLSPGTAGTDAVNKNQLDAVSAGLDPKASVRVATIAILDDNTDISGAPSYDNVGGTEAKGQITATLSVSGVFAIDGVTMVNGNRVLVKHEGDGSGLGGDANGIYTVTIAGTALTLDRATDFDSDAEVTAGAFMFTEEGTTHGDTGWVLITNDPITIGTASGTVLVFTQFSSSAALSAGDGIDIISNVVSVDVSDLVGAGIEDDGANNFRIAAAAAGAGLGGGGGSALSVNVDATTIEISTDILRIAATAAGSGLGGGGGSALVVNVGTGIEISSDAVRIAAAAAGDGLTGGGGVALAVNTGTGLEIDTDTVRIAAAAAGDGLTGGGGSALAVNVGTNLEIVADAVRIAASAAGNGLTGGGASALAVNVGTGIEIIADAVRLATQGDGIAGGGGTTLSVDSTAIAGAGLENDGSNNIRIAAAAAGDGLTGGAGSALAVNVGTSLEIVTDAVRLAATAAGAGLTGGGASALAVNVGTGIEIVSDAVRLAAQGDGIAGGAGSTLSVSTTDIAGTGLENDGSNNLRIAAAAAGDGLKGGGAVALAIEPADFAGAGLEDDGADNLRIAASAAGTGLSGGAGSALSVDYGTATGTAAQGDDVRFDHRIVQGPDAATFKVYSGSPSIESSLHDNTDEVPYRKVKATGGAEDGGLVFEFVIPEGATAIASIDLMAKVQNAADQIDVEVRELQFDGTVVNTTLQNTSPATQSTSKAEINITSFSTSPTLNAGDLIVVEVKAVLGASTREAQIGRCAIKWTR